MINISVKGCNFRQFNMYNEACHIVIILLHGKSIYMIISEDK